MRRPLINDREHTKPARAAFEAKVALLEGWAKNEAIPAEVPTLNTIDDIRIWTDESRGLKSWKSYSIAAPSGPNPDLRARLDAVLPLIKKIRSGAQKNISKPRRGKPISHVQVQNERDRLAFQNEELLTKQHDLQSEVLRLKQLLSAREQAYKDLLAKFNKISPFGRS